MTHWMHPPQLERHRERDQFAPTVEGARYGLSRELSLAIWTRVCADATDSAGRRDEEQARQRFHELAVRIAARGGRLRPDPGRVTRVGVEINGDSPGTWATDELRPRVPGRETLVAVEARRWKVEDERPMVSEASMADEASMVASKDAGGPTQRHELPGASEVTQAMAALQASPRPDQATPFDASVGDRFGFDLMGVAGVPPSSAPIGSTKAVPKGGEVHLRASAYPPGVRVRPKDVWIEGRLFDGNMDVIAPTPAHADFASMRATAPIQGSGIDTIPVISEFDVEAKGSGEPLPLDVRDDMEAALKMDLSDVRVHVGSQAEIVGAIAFTRGRDIFFAPGQYQPWSQHGRKLLGHELTHVVQQAQGRVRASQDAGGVGINVDAALEREADELGARAAQSDDMRQHDPAQPWRESRNHHDSHPEARGARTSMTAHSGEPVQRQSMGNDTLVEPSEHGMMTVGFIALDSLLNSLTELVPVWRALKLLDPPYRPAGIAPFPELTSGEKVPKTILAGLPLLSGPLAEEAVKQAAPKLMVIEGGAISGATSSSWWLRLGGRVLRLGGRALRLGGRVLGLGGRVLEPAGVVLIVVWPTSTQSGRDDKLNPITGGIYTSEAEYKWVEQLSPEQKKYLGVLYQRPEHGASYPIPLEPLSAPESHRIPILDSEQKEQEENLPVVDFYHGTDGQTAEQMANENLWILASGHGEFGAGFYTFLNEIAAEEVAEDYTRNREQRFTSWGVVDFEVPPETLAQFFDASTIGALLQNKLSRILVFPDKKASVTVTLPNNLGGIDCEMNWAEFVKTNAWAGKNVAWPYDLIIGPLKGKLRSQKRGVDQWVFGEDGVGSLNSPTVKRKISSTGNLL